MAEFMMQLFSIDELKALDQKQHEILKGEIRRQLISNPDIMRVFAKEIRPIYNQIIGRGPKRRKLSVKPVRRTK